jgi:hypothetical protein
MLFRRKYEFKPDKPASSTLSKLYLTPLQRKQLLKWALMGLTLTLLSLLQDVVFSRLRIGGAAFDLLPCGILLGCILMEPESAGVYALISSCLYHFSGTAPGVYVIALLTALGVLLCIFRRSYLKKGFFSTFLCAGFGIVVYKLTVFGIHLFLGATLGERFGVFALGIGLTLAAILPLYPLFVSICNIGGESWRE